MPTVFCRRQGYHFRAFEICFFIYFFILFFPEKKTSQIRYLLESGKAEEAELLRFPVSPFSAAFSDAGDAGAGVDVGVDDAGDAGDGVQGGSADHDGGSGGGGGGQGEISLDGEKAQADMREMERLVGIARDLSERGLLISVRRVRTSCAVARFNMKLARLPCCTLSKAVGPC